MAIADMDREAAEALFAEFAPLLQLLEEKGADYCLVGGLAVIAHCLANDFSPMRATKDADLLVPDDYTNRDFASDYLRVYAANPEQSEAIYQAMFGEGDFESLSKGESAFVNISFVGADEDLDGVDTPDFDVCRMLNGRTLSSIKRERINVCGLEVWVATIDELLGMKKDTVGLYGADITTSSRIQDFFDIRTLEALANGSGGRERSGGSGPAGGSA